MHKNAISIACNGKNPETQMSFDSRMDEYIKIIYYTAIKRMYYIYKENG